MISSDTLKTLKRTFNTQYTERNNMKAAVQTASTIIPIMLTWYFAVKTAALSYFVSSIFVLLLGLLLLRAFVLMHECGHGSLFKNPAYNRGVGFLLGVLVGMPQYVWSKHHAYHHATNGNWSLYRGPLSTLSTEEFSKLSWVQQRIYCYARNIIFAPVGGFIYLIFNPRYTWLAGSGSLFIHILKQKIRDPHQPLQGLIDNYKTPYWATSKEYWAMCWNNAVLLSLWVMMIAWIGAATFFTIYCMSAALAGAGGLILFTVQHNFEHAYASADAQWDYDLAAVEGSSYLVLPQLLNWFTADIAYHHIHHLNAIIPNYNLARCHAENEAHFRAVPRIHFTEILFQLKHILWDKDNRRIISWREYQQQKG